MIEIQGLSLILTDKCNASCRHCGLAAGPEKNSVMPVEKAKEYIQTISKYGSARLISYTGGEPFLRYDDLREIVSFAYGLGLYGEVVTNSFWASDITETKKILSELKSLGVVNFVTSLDDFHAEYINPAYIRNAVYAACRLDYNVTVKTMDFPDSTYSCEHAREYLRECLDAGGGSIKFFSQAPVRAGRAVNKPDTAGPGGGIGNSRKNSGGRCATVIRFPAIHPAGEVYPCCGFGQGYRLLGNAGAQPLDDILSNMQRNLFYNLIAHLGPENILRAAQKYIKARQSRALSIKKNPQDGFANICEVCNYLVKDAAVSSAVRQLLDEISTAAFSIHAGE